MFLSPAIFGHADNLPGIKSQQFAFVDLAEVAIQHLGPRLMDGAFALLLLSSRPQRLIEPDAPQSSARRQTKNGRATN
jgi:hypothetical protein